MRTPILFVEPNPVVQKLGKRLLERLGCRVDIAEELDIAAGFVHNCRYEIVFVNPHVADSRLENFIGAVRRHQNAAGHPAIVAVGDTEGLDLQALKRAGIDDWIGRSLNIEYLRAALVVWGRSQLERDEAYAPQLGRV